MDNKNPLKPETHEYSFLIREFKSNAFFITAIVLFAGLLIFFVPFQVSQIIDVRQKTSATNEAIARDQKRLAAIRTFATNDTDSLLLVLQSIYPTVDDRFSIFMSLDQIEKLYGVQVIKFTSPFAGRTQESTIKVQVQIQGAPQNMLAFLKGHTFQTGRFFTIDDVTYNVALETLSFSAVYHSGETPIGESDVAEYDQRRMENIREIVQFLKAKNPVFQDVSKVVQPAGQTEQPNLNYKPADNPFGGQAEKIPVIEVTPTKAPVQ